ncbi:MAG: hypothetical protein JW839_07680 [Candidatus Lokiarchaeota archaeon]|nr:hypothetical protein [Candidatus Lokiarchaeota archaeon]
MALDQIKVEILGAESMGVRSMCCTVTTPDISFLMDPGCSLGPRKGNEIPHPLEYKKLHELTDRILSSASRCGRIFISHYHHDHYKPRMADELYVHTSNALTSDLYRGKEIYIKSPGHHIGRNQEARCRYFKQSVSRLASTIHDADFRRFEFGGTTVDFSHPVPHGEPGTKLGHVIMARVSVEDEHFVFAPDVQGPVVEDTAKFILDTPVDVLFVGGPPFYLEEGLKSFPFDEARRLMVKLHEHIPLIVLDHHCCRDQASYNSYVKATRAEAKGSAAARGHVITSAAGFMGTELAFLESSRDRFYAECPPSADFVQWMNLAPGKRNQTLPPVE